jgi:hypothetical protein
MAESDNRYIIGVDNGWFGDCDNDADVKCRFHSEKRPGKLFDTETGELLRVIGW